MSVMSSEGSGWACWSRWSRLGVGALIWVTVPVVFVAVTAYTSELWASEDLFWTIGIQLIFPILVSMGAGVVSAIVALAHVTIGPGPRHGFGFAVAALVVAGLAWVWLLLDIFLS